MRAGRIQRRSLLKGCAASLVTPAFAATKSQGSQVINERIVSRNIAGNLIKIAPERGLSVYLPAGYTTSRKRYPVIYFLHSLFEDQTALFGTNGAAGLDSAIASGAIGDVIVVTADFSTPLGGSFYVNSPVTGNWQDFLTDELVPFIDAKYRTIASAAGRGIAGDRGGGHGAIRIAMRHSEVFGSVYALQPIGTGNGIYIMNGRPNFELIQAAKSIDDLKSDGFTMLFTAIYQAHLPNPAKAPLFIDPPARRANGALVIDPAVTDRLMNSFLLERQIATYAGNLNRLRGFKFDWGRSDGNYDHVYSNQAFAHKLNEYGVANEAEEYNGGWGDRTWGKTGRFVTDMLPFFARTLAFAPPRQT
jgi:S-formylglutathione hydrolase FrmB